MERVRMPGLGETVTKGTIVRWLKQAGNEVAVDDVLFEVSTDKVDTEVPSASPGSFGRSTSTRATPSSSARCWRSSPTPPTRWSTRHRRPRRPGPTSPPVRPQRQPALRKATPDRRGPPVAQSAGAEDAGGRAALGAPPAGNGFLSPVVQRMLAEHGLAAGEVVGSGRDGRITRADVLAAATNRNRSAATAPIASPSAAGGPVQLADLPTPGPDDEVIEFSRARRNTAANMMRSLATSAHTLVVVEVDYHAVDAVRRAAGLSFLPFVARAVVDALGEFPHVNASVSETTC